MKFRNPKYCIDRISIDCEIDHPVYGWIPYTCNPNDNESMIDAKKLYNDILEAGNIIDVSEEEIRQNLEYRIRDRRNILLVSNVDSVICNPLRWKSLTEKQKKEYEIYRQALLDITDQKDFPYNVVWPEEPK